MSPLPPLWGHFPISPLPGAIIAASTQFEHETMADEIKSQVDPDLYESEVGLVEMMLEIGPIIEAVHEVRTGASTQS